MNYIQILALPLTSMVVWDQLLYFSEYLFPLLEKEIIEAPLGRGVETIKLNKIKIDFSPSLFIPYLSSSINGATSHSVKAQDKTLIVIPDFFLFLKSQVYQYAQMNLFLKYIPNVCSLVSLRWPHPSPRHYCIFSSYCGGDLDFPAFSCFQQPTLHKFDHVYLLRLNTSNGFPAHLIQNLQSTPS